MVAFLSCDLWDYFLMAVSNNITWGMPAESVKQRQRKYVLFKKYGLVPPSLTLLRSNQFNYFFYRFVSLDSLTQEGLKEKKKIQNQ